MGTRGVPSLKIAGRPSFFVTLSLVTLVAAGCDSCSSYVWVAAAIGAAPADTCTSSTTYGE